MPKTPASQALAWFDAEAERVIAHAEESKSPSQTIVCASGISPSGPIHLGNLREVLTVHFVAEALRRAGRDVEHIHSWDDFDRFRATLYVKNLFNEHYVASLRRISGSVGGAGAVVQAIPRDFDRYVGGSFAVNF